MSIDFLNYTVQSEPELEALIHGLKNRGEIHKQILRFGFEDLLETDERYRLENKLYQLVLDKNRAQHSMAAQPPPPAAPPTGVAQSTGGQPGQQAVAAQPPPPAAPPTGVAPSTGAQAVQPTTQQYSLSKEELFNLIADAAKLRAKGTLSLELVTKQFCLSNNVDIDSAAALKAFLQDITAKNALDTWCWVIGMTLLCLPLLYGAMSARMEHDLVWNSKMAEKHPEAYEADKEFVNSYWWFAVLVLLICSTLLYFKCKLGCALPSVLMYAAAVVYHYKYEDIDFPQMMTDLSFPLMYLVGWWMLLKMAQNLLSSIK